MTVKSLNQNQISMLKQMLERRFADPYVEVPVVNTTLQILGYVGWFDCNYETFKVRYRVNKND